MRITRNVARKSRNYRWPEVILSAAVWVVTALAFHYPPAPRTQTPGMGTTPTRREAPLRAHPERRPSAARASAIG